MTIQETFQVQFTNQVYGGAAKGILPDGKVILVPYGISGETALVQVIEDKKGYCKGKILDIPTPSNWRIEPRCQHFGICGGCHFQHISYSGQLEIKLKTLQELLAHSLKNIQIPDIEITPSPGEWNYRNTIQMHLDYMGKLGYMNTRSNDITPITECWLPQPPLTDLWKTLEFDPGMKLDRIELRCGEEGDTQIVIHSQGFHPPALDLTADTSVVHIGPNGCETLAGSPLLTMDCLNQSFQVSAGSFFQVNSLQAEAIIHFLKDHIQFDNKNIFIDGYCGVGLISKFFASEFATCIGIESNSYACEDYQVNLDSFDNVVLYIGDIGEVLPAINTTSDIMLVDPPRAGLSQKVKETILGNNIKQFIYISCDPATMVRDVAQLIANGYKITAIKAFDMFPQTFHLETVVILEKMGTN